MNHVNVEIGDPSAIPLIGDVWRIRIPNKTNLHRERIMKIVDRNKSKVSLMEVPFSPFTIDYSITEIIWVEKIVD